MLAARIGTYQITATLCGIWHRVPHARAAGRTDRRRQPPVGALGRAGECHGHRRSAARSKPPRRVWAATSIRDRCQSCRCSAATGCRSCCWRRATGRTRQSATPVPDRHGGDVREFRAEHRWPAGDVGVRDRQPAPVQQGFNRGVSVHLEPVRRDAGPVVRRPGERDHQVRYQHAVRVIPSATSATANGTSPMPCCTKCCRTRTSSMRWTFGGPILQGQGALLRKLRLRAPAADFRSGTRRIPAFNVDAERHERTSRWKACAWTTSCPPQTRLMTQGQRGERLRAVFRRRQQSPGGDHRTARRRHGRSSQQLTQVLGNARGERGQAGVLVVRNLQ